MRKDVLPHHHINSVIYKYTCSCGSDYIGRTSNRLDPRIKHHLPARILNLEFKRGQLVNTSGSSIADHMINSKECVADFNVDRFSILSRSHSIYPFTFDLFSLPFYKHRDTVCWDWTWDRSLTICSSLLLPPTSWFCLTLISSTFFSITFPF